jgi:hypothetical protein
VVRPPQYGVGNGTKPNPIICRIFARCQCKIERETSKRNLEHNGGQNSASPRMVHPTSNKNLWHPFLYTCKTGQSEASNSTILSDFPLESRALLSPELVIVKKCEMGASTKASEKRTACTRCCHFIYWCILRRVYDQVFPVIKLPDTALVYLLACYTAYLATGHAIGLKSIKSGTVDGYLLTIKKFLKKFDPKSDRDARMFTGAAVIAAPIKKVIDEMKRFEKQPN